MLAGVNRLAWLTCSLLAVVAVACKGKKDVGEACESIVDCPHCVDGVCRAGVTGDPCTKGFECDYEHGFTCWESRCLTRADAELARAAQQQRAAEQQRKEDIEKEARLLKESGITELPAEQAAHPPGPGTRVRVVTTKAKASAFAACRADERLTGGGCKSDGVLAGSYPSGHGAEDSVGARWNCANSTTYNSGAEITAYALCSPLAPR